MKFRKILSCLLALGFILSFSSACSNSTAVEPEVLITEAETETQTPPPSPVADNFIVNTADFAVELFKRSYDDTENSLVSPASVLFAMSMAANGANGETLTQMENALGGGMPIAELNEHLRNYRLWLPSEENAKLSIANSIWYRDEFDVRDEFLQINKDYYNALVKSALFDPSTVKEINGWVEENTDGMIDEILNDIPNAAIMYLINAVAFDAQWANIYEEHQVRERDFTNINGEIQKADMMSSDESIYIRDDKAIGFIKPYDSSYSFAAVLPNEDVSIDEYISSMTGENLMELLNGQRGAKVKAELPKFSYEYGIELKSPLEDMGITTAFDENYADFKGIGYSPRGGNIFISRVMHKTFIEVDEKGTKAAAVTVVEMEETDSVSEPNYIYVILDRPFIYMIIDNETNLPLFMGVLNTLP
ncbi:MAG: serpin family protein [Oscillospiraceae bacterium]|nr:serpin family protein [Oscillospiraceae bacterium]